MPERARVPPRPVSRTRAADEADDDEAAGRRHPQAPAQAPPWLSGRHGPDRAGRPAEHRGARAPGPFRRRRFRRRGAGRPRVHPAGGQAPAAQGRARLRAPPPAGHHRVGVPGPARGGGPGHGGPAARGADPDRGPRGQGARRALRGPGRPPVPGRQRLPRQGPERPAVDGGRLRRHRQGPQRRPVRGRGELRRERPGGRVQAHRAGPQVRPVGAGPGDQGPGRAQGRAADQPGQPARPLPGVRARRVDDGHQPQAARHRAHPAQADPQAGHAGERRRHRADRGRGGLGGGTRPRRGQAVRAVGEHRAEGQVGQRRPSCSTASRT